MEDISSIYSIIRSKKNLPSNLANYIKELAKVLLRLKRTREWNSSIEKEWYEEQIITFRGLCMSSNPNFATITSVLREIEAKFFEIYANPFIEAGDNISDFIEDEDNFDLKLLKIMEKVIKKAIFHDGQLQDLKKTISFLLEKLESYYLPRSIYIESLLRNLLVSENNEQANSDYIWDLCHTLFYDTQAYLDHQRLNIICHNFQYSPETRTLFTPELFPKKLVLKVTSPLTKYNPKYEKIGEDQIFLPQGKEITISGLGFEESPRFCKDRLVIGGRLLNDISELDILMEPDDKTLNHYQFLIICASDGYYLIDTSSSPNSASIGLSISSTVLVEGMLLKLGKFKIINVHKIEPRGDEKVFHYQSLTGVPLNVIPKAVITTEKPWEYKRGDNINRIELSVSRSQGEFINDGMHLVYNHKNENTLSWRLLKTYDEYTKGLPSKAVKLECETGIICVYSCFLFYEIN
ncbi:unnamed protein product [Blepharisma stoltei]|uniref:FHA domain-containing protein n=1 Tax=Blepharisma stoltei TaxID=1481888 RepID=A0AAU9IJY9_9CILI|nr:unnamed protein product [Blepharisma stoltei]